MTTVRILSIRNLFQLLFVLFLATNSTAIAQQSPIAKVSSTNVTTIYTQLDDAIAASADGDIIYLPGGAFSITRPVNKRITMMGVGHYPDSSIATGTTSISGELNLFSGASDFVLDGVYLSGSVNILDTLSGVKVFRSNLYSLRVVRDSRNGYLINGMLKYSIVRNAIYVDFNSDDLVNTTVSNCVIYSNLYFGRGAYINNCIILNCDGGDYGLQNNSYYNCIIFGNTPGQSGNVRAFIKCAFGGSDYGNSAFQDCLFNRTGEILFGHPVSTTFNYTAGFYRVAEAIALGTDGKEIGIYGGPQPYKEGAIPPSPHIRKKEVEATTGANGMLKIKFNVSVQ